MDKAAVTPVSRFNHTTIFIAGAGHSGSTLLGLILGSHPDAFYPGEAAKTRFLGDESKALKKRVCKLCGPDCVIWGDFVPAETPDLYEQLAARTSRPIIIDSSKGMFWISAKLEEVREAGGKPVLLFLQRDGRAVINSRVRKYPERDPAAMVESWLQQIRETADLYHAFKGPKMVVRYEELATSPEPVIRSICTLAGVDFHAGMLDFSKHEHHVLGGNNGTQFQVARRQGLDGLVGNTAEDRPYYGEHPKGIVLDLRWKSELPAEVLTVFDAMAGSENAEFAWG
ncbi:MAG: sulfotransferase [Myxococcales bacterium]|nr:sulfotransferase [Myxococcales bacterium]